MPSPSLPKPEGYQLIGPSMKDFEVGVKDVVRQSRIDHRRKFVNWPLRQLRRWRRWIAHEEAWGIRVTGCAWCPRTHGDLNDLNYRYGYGTEEFTTYVHADPERRSTRTYGPYSHKQAVRVADYLRRPEIAEAEGIDSVTPFHLERFVPGDRVSRHRAGLPVICHGGHGLKSGSE